MGRGLSGLRKLGHSRVLRGRGNGPSRHCQFGQTKQARQGRPWEAEPGPERRSPSQTLKEFGLDPKTIQSQ